MRSDSRHAEVIAHRGASAYAPENTAAAFDLALAMGADALELDVRATRDDELVLLHDRTLLRTTGDPRRIADLSRSDLAGLPAPARPPTLAEVLDRYGDRTQYLIELKDPRERHDRAVTEAIAARGLQQHVVVQSFDHLALSRIARRDRSLALAALFEEGADVAAALDAVPPCVGAIGPCAASVDADIVLAARSRGLAVRAWTVNEQREMQRLLDAGVDGIITDAPDRAREVVPRTAARAA